MRESVIEKIRNTSVVHLSTTQEGIIKVRLFDPEIYTFSGLIEGILEVTNQCQCIQVYPLISNSRSCSNYFI